MKSATTPDFPLLDRITRRAFAHMVAMIHLANHRSTADKTDPKVGGHPASCASSLDFLAALHLVVREPGDFVCCKPHASPADHALHHALGLFRHHGDGTWFTDSEAEAVMTRLRSFSHDGAPVFQSYHAEADPDHWRFLPSGSVGIPPVAAVYLALAYRYAQQHGWDVDEPHFWCMMGDSEFREGSLLEVLPEVAERELGNVTWIIDYNRQNLDGTRIPNNRGLQGTDADRIERTAVANGWEVIQLRHGSFREQVFARKGGDALRKVFERGFTDYHYQALLWKRDAVQMRAAILSEDKSCQKLVESLKDDEIVRLWNDLGGHDHASIIKAFEQCKKDKHRPTLVIAHTVKGRGLHCAAANGNHSAMPDEDEVKSILAEHGLSLDRPFVRFDAKSEEGRFCTQRGLAMRLGIEALGAQGEANRQRVAAQIAEMGMPQNLDINLKLAPTTHTQWMWGQLAAKLVRIGVYDELAKAGKEAKAGKALTNDEAKWHPLADLMMTMAPDVGTSTNINPAMDEKIFGPKHEENWEAKLDLHERLRPELAPTDEAWTRHIRFEIAEANCMSALGSFGKMDFMAGIPFLPMMTVYDFFIKRALDQLYYNLYWNSSFVLVGTPSGITLSPEGAQHSWKSDIQIPNLITWEPAFAIEMEWILCDAIRRHFARDNKGRKGVLIRAVTRALHQNLLLDWQRKQARWKREMPAGALLGLTTQDGGLHEAECPHAPDAEILAGLREHALAGAYRLVDWRGYRGYHPGENVVELFVMGALVPEAVQAAEQLLDRGVYANVTVVTSPDLLCGELGRQTRYEHLVQTLGVNGNLHLRPAGGAAGPLGPSDVIDLAGRRVPVVSVHDGEIGLLDNLGSILGVPQIAKAVVKFSKSGTPAHIFEYHGLHAAGIADACGQALAQTAMEKVQIHESALAVLRGQQDRATGDWRELWPNPA